MGCDAGAVPIRVGHHRPKLVDAKPDTVAPYPLATVKDRARRITLYQQGNC